MKAWKALLLSLFFITASRPQSLDWGGYVKAFFYPNLNSPYNYDRLGTRLQLKASGSLSPRTAYFAALDFNYEVSHNTGMVGEPRAAGMSVFPVEFYVDMFFSAVDIRVGQQFIFWGRTDWIMPTDNINPWDYTNITAEIEDYRIPVLAAKVDYYAGPLKIEGVWIPKFLPNRIPVELPDSINGLPVNALPPGLPETKVGNSEFALRVSSQIADVDFSLSYYNGADKMPSVSMGYVPVQRVFTSRISYEPYQVFGGDFVFTKGKAAFKGEGAYFLTADRNGKNISVENPHIQYVLGMDYNVSNDLLLNAQFVHYIRFKYDYDYEESERLKLGMPTDNIPQQQTFSGSARLQYNITDFTSLQLVSVVNFEHWDYFILPILTYSISDGLNLYAGATVFNGPAGSPFGRNKDYSRGFIELKYSF